MKTTKVESFAVVSIAWRISGRDRRRRTRAIASAPDAPMAPPSVGVAQPRKIVPRTRKINASGGEGAERNRPARGGRRPRLYKPARAGPAGPRPPPPAARTDPRPAPDPSGHVRPHEHL